MPNNPSNVEQFVSKVNQRLNRFRIRDTAIWATLIGGGVMLVVALFYVLTGYRVPAMWYLGILGATLLGAAGWAIATRSSANQAASFADKFFGLKDSISSYLGFAQTGRQGGFYELQARQTETLVQDKSVEKIVRPPNWYGISIGLILVAISVSLGFKATSPEIIKRMEQEKQTLAMTIEVNDQIKQLVEELQESSEDPHERKNLNPDKLREWVNELKETTDLHEAKRQYSKMELRLNRAAEALRQRKEEELLDKAAEELEKDLDSIELSKDLKHKKYEKAAEDLKDFKPTEKIKDPKKLSEARKELAKLKAVAKRMATAARKTQGASKNQGQQSQDAGGDDADGDLSESDDSDLDESEGEEGDLSDAIQDLEDAVDGYDEALEQIEMYEDPYGKQPQWSEEELEDAYRAVQNKMDDLGDRMRRMAGRRKARSKLKKLCKRVAQAQSNSGSKQPGGTKAGKQDGTRERSETDKRDDNGQNTKLKGIKGSGPSITQIQAADDGDGTSRKKSTAKQRDFKRQFESFVEREDIPEDLKSGVKEYFTKIHQVEPETNNGTLEIKSP